MQAQSQPEADVYSRRIGLCTPSPGGTTAEALYHMEKGGLRTALSRGIFAACQRSIALGRGKKQSEVEVE